VAGHSIPFNVSEIEKSVVWPENLNSISVSSNSFAPAIPPNPALPPRSVAATRLAKDEQRGIHDIAVQFNSHEGVYDNKVHDIMPNDFGRRSGVTLFGHIHQKSILPMLAGNKPISIEWSTGRAN
jgi:hypothetical protein